MKELEQLYQQYFKDVYLYAKSLAGEEQLAQDIACVSAASTVAGETVRHVPNVCGASSFFSPQFHSQAFQWEDAS